MKISKSAWVVIGIVAISAISIGAYLIVDKNKKRDLEAQKKFKSEIDRLNAEKALSKGSYADLDEKKENESIKDKGLTFR